MEIVDGVVQEVPAQILSEYSAYQYDFGADILAMTYKIHPYGTKQYILRDNGIINVNIGYEAPDHLSFNYLTFQISADGKTASLTDYGSGCYLLQLNNVAALDAFRKTYTGEGHILPADTAQLPWDWLLAMNGEKNDAPLLAESDLPAVNKDFYFENFDHYNVYDFFNGFIVSEKVVNEKVYTEYRYRDEIDDISILTDIQSYEVVSITYNGKEKPLPDLTLTLHAGGAASSFSTIHYADITGDMQKELIFEEGFGGTGVWDNYCYIFNPETMEQYPIDLNISQMTSKLNVTLTDFEPEGGALSFNLAYENQTADVIDQLYFSFDPENDTTKMSLAEANRYFHYTPEEETHNVYYNPETGYLEAEVWIAIQNTVPMTYAGELNVQYIWDAATEKFVIDLNTVKLVTYNGDATVADTSSAATSEKDTTTEEVYLDTSWYYMRGAQFLKDIHWEAFSTRISEDENLTLQKFMPILTDKEFVWIYRLADNTHTKKQTTIRKLLADQYDMHGINQVEPNIYTFCFADLFQTGNKDLILCLCNLPGWEWLIFHEEDGVVYCMDMSIRWFSYPQTNGIYTASNGADDTSYYRLIFADGDILEEQIGRVIGDELYIDDVKQSSSAYEAWKKENLTTEYYPYYHPIEEIPSTD